MVVELLEVVLLFFITVKFVNILMLTKKLLRRIQDIASMHLDFFC